MTNPAAPIGVTYRGTDVQQNPFGIFLELVGGVNEVPLVRGEDHTVPALPGRVLDDRENDVLPLELKGWIAGQGADGMAQRADVATLRQTIRNLFDPTISGSLVATLEDGSTATIQARTLGDGLLWGQIVPQLFSLSIRLESAQAAWDIEPAAS